MASEDESIVAKSCFIAFTSFPSRPEPEPVPKEGRLKETAVSWSKETLKAATYPLSVSRNSGICLKTCRLEFI